jgi:hypothetical protein
MVSPGSPSGDSKGQTGEECPEFQNLMFLDYDLGLGEVESGKWKGERGKLKVEG